MKKVIKFNIASRTIRTEKAEDEYSYTKEVLLLNEAGEEIGKQNFLNLMARM